MALEILVQKERSKSKDGKNGFTRMEISVFHLQEENNELFGRYYCPGLLIIVLSMFSTGLNIDSYSLSNATLLRGIDLG